MLAPRRPRAQRRASSTRLPARAPGTRSTADVRREEQFLVWLAELVHLTEMEGRATARLWYERMRKPDGLPRSSSDRQWERLKVALVEHGVPHELGAVPSSDDSGEAPGAVTIKVLVSKTDLDKYRQRRKRCKAPTCGKWLPPRTPFFHRDPTRPDGLSQRCAACQRAAQAEHVRRGRAKGIDPEKIARRRASFRIASAKRRAKLAKIGRFDDKARDAVRRALAQGRLSKPATCSQCGAVGEIEAHHHAGGDA